MKRLLIVIAAAALAFAAWLVASGGDGTASSGSADGAVAVPELSGEAAEGEALFADNCAACHGENGAGTEQGPPLVHQIYEPGHHGDMAFVLAVKNGVQGHHWDFGNMMPVDGVTDEEIVRIIAYVRAVQRANGIE